MGGGGAKKKHGTLGEEGEKMVCRSDLDVSDERFRLCPSGPACTGLLTCHKIVKITHTTVEPVTEPHRPGTSILGAPYPHHGSSSLKPSLGT